MNIIESIVRSPIEDDSLFLHCFALSRTMMKYIRVRDLSALDALIRNLRIMGSIYEKIVREPVESARLGYTLYGVPYEYRNGVYIEEFGKRYLLYVRIVTKFKSIVYVNIDTLIRWLIYLGRRDVLDLMLKHIEMEYPIEGVERCFSLKHLRRDLLGEGIWRP